MPVLNCCQEAEMKKGFVSVRLPLCLVLNEAPLANEKLKAICAEHVADSSVMGN